MRWRGFCFHETIAIVTIGCLGLLLSFEPAMLDEFMRLFASEDRGYQIFANLRAPHGSFDTVSMEDILLKKVSPDLIRDRQCGSLSRKLAASLD
ncbi:MAG: hypothetical protein SXA11_25905 [Cyanobacteriota bacterium]|nr:hypothetical protein [Cyanobacteriota bacterium]